MKINKIFWFGQPLSTQALHDQRLPKWKALPLLSADPLSSVAYGTEEVLQVLILAGVAALTLSLPIALAICGLILILGASYHQTIQAYPIGGGAFTVARDNLGLWPGLLAAVALLLDYLLTVAVSVSAGVRAITSAFPGTIPWTVSMCIIAIGFITLMNLRGARESASVFAGPTYAFIVLMVLLIGSGLYQIWQGQLGPESVPVAVGIPMNALDQFLEPLTILLILRAFSAGCVALTGIECVANSVSVFKAPAVKNAQKMLFLVFGLLAVMFFGITYIADILQIKPQYEQSVLSQIAHTVFGKETALYYTLQAATALILMLAANTAFVGFPRLASMLSDNKFLPKQLSALGDRLSFSNGILLLAVLSSILVYLFHGNTHSLIPLYSVGVFLAFSLSQLGMVRRWLKLKGEGWYWKASINALGCLTTTVALLVIVESKFMQGAWMIVLAIPIGLFVFKRIYRHYRRVDKELSVTSHQAKNYLVKMHGIQPKVILPISKMHRGTLAALQFARTVSTDVTAVAVDIDHEQTVKLKQTWDDLGVKIPLVMIESPYRSTLGPLKKFIHEQDRRDPERGLCMIVLPAAVPTRWWHYILHNQRATLLKAGLYYNRQYKGTTRIFVDVPYHLKR
jgi:amino acid transporter